MQHAASRMTKCTAVVQLPQYTIVLLVNLGIQCTFIVIDSKSIHNHIGREFEMIHSSASDSIRNMSTIPLMLTNQIETMRGISENCQHNERIHSPIKLL